MAALIRQANKHVWNGQWTKDKKEKRMVKKKGKERENNNNTFWKERGGK